MQSYLAPAFSMARMKPNGANETLYNVLPGLIQNFGMLKEWRHMRARSPTCEGQKAVGADMKPWVP